MCLCLYGLLSLSTEVDGSRWSSTWQLCVQGSICSQDTGLTIVSGALRMWREGATVQFLSPVDTHISQTQNAEMCRNGTQCASWVSDISTIETTVGRCFWGFHSGLWVTPSIHAPPFLAPAHPGLGDTTSWSVLGVGFCVFFFFNQKHSLFPTKTSELVQQESCAWHQRVFFSLPPPNVRSLF